MDLEKFRAQWDDPEFQKSYLDEDLEPTSAVIERFERIEAREKRRRQIRNLIPRIALAAVTALNVVDKVRKKTSGPNCCSITRNFCWTSIGAWAEISIMISGHPRC